MMERGPCRVCLTQTEHKCSGCQDVHYCTREHQKQDWKQHKHQCVPARVKADPTFGRYLEATRDIKAGDIILKEKPLMNGPMQVTPPVCLGCYKLLEEGKTVDCIKCGWPCCSEACTLKEDHIPECYYTQQRGKKVSISTFGMPHPNYECITTLRCLYQRDHNPKLWKKMQAFQSHCEQRRGSEKWNNDRKMVVEFIWQFFKLEGTFTEEEIMRCCGVLQVNGHEVPLMEPEYLGLFDRMSMAEHNCCANCYKSFTSDGQILLCAGVDIAAGSHVTLSYTDSMSGTGVRRRHLAQWFFECCCERCSDVTEFGTHYSAVKCKKKDCKGYLLPETFVVPLLAKTTIPSPASKGWVCGGCKDMVSDDIIQQLLRDIDRELSVMPKGDPEACEKFIDQYSSYLHPSHYYMTNVRHALAQTIGQESEKWLVGVTDDRLLLKTRLCREIADLFRTLAPAEYRVRGYILFELHAAIAEAGRRLSLIDGPTSSLLGYLVESREILMTSASLLRHEPPELPEGRVLQQARANLVQLDELIRNLSRALPSPM
ncbi:SET domain-containing protein SmydA-8-like [Plodia interpunctella]|uniref:SET domain-containing protein SmydA-8-like n=1 Tax=Plodia interpunctella TaxID=58824 RepID=UPI002367EFDB|nr:SET domain-containing protein SmydA-8-like [Plodia interpunctella]